MANVAIDRLEFEISVSISGLQLWTDCALKEATLCRMRIAANFVTARGEVRNSCRVCMAWVISASVTS